MSPMDPARYLDLFVSESRDHLAAAAALAGRIAADRTGGTALRELFRHLHSLKGMAATMGFAPMNDLAHAAETLLEAMREGTVAADPERCALLADAAAALERMVERAERGVPVDDASAAGLHDSLRAAARGRVEGASERATHPAQAAPTPLGPATWRVAVVIDREKPFPAVRAAMLLGRFAGLGRLIASDPPMALLRTGRFDGHLSVLLQSDLVARDLAERMARLEDVETFTILPAPAAEQPQRRSPARWVRVRADLLDRLMEDADELSRAQQEPGGAHRARMLARRLQRDLAEASLVPFETAVQRLERGAGELARSLGKSLRLEIEGRDVRLARVLLDHLVDPLLHLVRNAVDHGLETPDERHLAGKPPTGVVRLAVVRAGESIRIEVADDGRGLDPAALRRAAAEGGFVSVSEAARLSDGDAVMLATLAGLSMARARTEVSGRGVGLDVVKASVEEIGGRLAIDNAPGRGTRITLVVPLTLAVIQALLVRCGGELFAIPASAILRAIAPDPALRAGARELATMLGVAPLGDPGRRAALELVGSAGAPVVVDEVVGRREIVLRPVAPALLETGIYSGAAVLDDGTIVPVIALESFS